MSAADPAAGAAPLAPVAAARALVRRKARLAIVAPLLVLAYLVHVALAFDLAHLPDRARPGNGLMLLQDFWSYKVHVTRDNRTGRVTSSIEGMRNATFDATNRPGWIAQDAQGTHVTLPLGHAVDLAPDGLVVLTTPTARYRIRPTATGIEAAIPDPPPGFSVSDSRFSAALPGGARLSVTRARTEVSRRQPGWELFLFDLDSPFQGRGWAELARLAVGGPRLDPARPNIVAMARDFWTNEIWHHGDTAWALVETILMAFLGSFGAGLVALPLAFLAAANFAPLGLVRQGARRIFDLLRGVDALIWTIVLSRAFGPGPLTGALAILLTETGTFGKLFSEALENIDERPVDGLRATGAGPLDRIRWAVLPQVAPVITSQLLYYFESNTRSATVIGAITGGGMGLLLMQAMQTQKDWEHVAWYIVLIVVTVMVMDWVSGRIRARLIRG